MKKILTMMLSLLLVTSLLLGTLTVSGAKYEWQDGVVPDGWTYPDSIEDITATSLLNPVNPNASQEARNLYAYLCTLTDSPKMLSGQFDINTDDTGYRMVLEETGIAPALFSARYVMDTTDPVWMTDGDGNQLPVLAESNTCSNFTNVDKANNLFKYHYDQGHVLLIHSDGNTSTLVKQLKANDLSATGGIVHLDATNPDRDMQTYALWIRYQENLITALTALEASGVKAYMWRPWVEFNYHDELTGSGSVTQEACEGFVRVYQQTVQMMIDAGLTGFLSVYSPGTWNNTISRNPGNDYVDSYAVTLYSDNGNIGHVGAGQFYNYEWYKRSGKPIGFSEWSCRTGTWSEVNQSPRGSSFELLRKSLTNWPELTWVNYWGNYSYSSINAGGGAGGNDDGMLYLDSPYVITADELPDYRNMKINNPGLVQLFTAANGAGEYVGLEETAYTYNQLKGMGIDPTQVRSLRCNTDYAIVFYDDDNCDGGAYRFGFSDTDISAKAAKNFRSCQVVRLPNVALDQWEIYASVNDNSSWKANDGKITVWEADITDAGNESAPGTAWLYVDLGQPATVGRYTVKSASYAGQADQFNVSDFQIQYSYDGNTWKTVDTIAGNTSGSFDSYIDPVTAQYYRLYITKANSGAFEAMANTVIIAEFELYGVDPGLMVNYPDEEANPTTTTKKTTTTTKKTTTTTKKVTTTTTKKTTKKTTTTTALKLATPKVTVSNATKGVKVSWGKVSKADKYYVYRKTGSGSWSKIKTTTSVSYIDEGAKAGKSYQYMVKAVKGSVTSGYKAVSITRLSVPKVTVSNASKGVKVSWGKVTGASKYYVYRKTGSGSWSKIKTTTSTSYTDTKAAAGKSYQYMVKAVKGDYTSYYKAASIRRLKAPSSVKLAKATKGFKVSWSKVTGATKYEVYRKTGNGSYTKIATTTKTAYTDKTAKKGKYYTYRVRAVYSSYKSVFKTGSKTKR